MLRKFSLAPGIQGGDWAGFSEPKYRRRKNGKHMNFSHRVAMYRIRHITQARARESQCAGSRRPSQVASVA